MPPKKTKMKETEFYDVRTKSRMTFEKDQIKTKTIDGSKYKDSKPRYMLVAEYEGDDGTMKSVHKFCGETVAAKYPAL